MARDGITFEQVAAAADGLVGDGQQPTIRAVRERLGTGSPNTVHRHLVAWREARPQAAASAPDLPASLTAAIAAEIQQAAARARAEVESQLVRVQTEAGELASAGEVLEVERDELAESVGTLTSERDKEAATAAERAATIERMGGEHAAEVARLAQAVEREQQAAEAARVELATLRLRIEGHAERQADQAKEIERLRAELDKQRTGRVEAEQHAAVVTARLDAMTDRATRAEARAELAEDNAQQAIQQAREAAAEARRVAEGAAELRGRLSAVPHVEIPKPEAAAPPAVFSQEQPSQVATPAPVATTKKPKPSPKTKL